MTDANKAAQMLERVYCKIHKHPGSDDVNIIAAYEYSRPGLTEYVREDLTTPAANTEDSEAVDDFASAMKEKMAVKAKQGRGGWQDESVCTIEYLQNLLNEQVEKGDPVDVANIAMMLFHRGAKTKPALQRPEPSEVMAAYVEKITSGVNAAIEAYLLKTGADPHNHALQIQHDGDKIIYTVVPNTALAPRQVDDGSGTALTKFPHTLTRQVDVEGYRSLPEEIEQYGIKWRLLGGHYGTVDHIGMTLNTFDDGKGNLLAAAPTQDTKGE